jgi:hypothetical protein
MVKPPRTSAERAELRDLERMRAKIEKLRAAIARPGITAAEIERLSDEARQSVDKYVDGVLAREPHNHA